MSLGRLYSKRSPPVWLLIGLAPILCFSGTNQKPERRRPFGTGLVRHCPQGLFSQFFTFLRSIYIFRPFRLSLAPFICPWVSEDDAALLRGKLTKLSSFNFTRRFQFSKPNILTYCERFEPRSHFKRLSLIVRVNVVLNRTVVVDSD